MLSITERGQSPTVLALSLGLPLTVVWETLLNYKIILSFLYVPDWWALWTKPTPSGSCLYPRVGVSLYPENLPLLLLFLGTPADMSTSSSSVSQLLKLPYVFPSNVKPATIMAPRSLCWLVHHTAPFPVQPGRFPKSRYSSPCFCTSSTCLTQDPIDYRSWINIFMQYRNKLLQHHPVCEWVGGGGSSSRTIRLLFFPFCHSACTASYQSSTQ